MEIGFGNTGEHPSPRGANPTFRVGSLFYAIHLPLYAIIILFNNPFLQCVDFQYYDLPPAEALFHISLEIDDLTIVIADRAGRGHLTDK